MKPIKWFPLFLVLVMALCSVCTALADDTAYGAVDQQSSPLTPEKSP